LKALAQAIPVYSTEQEKPIAKYDFIFQEINLSHFVRKMDVQSSHFGLNSQGRKFRFLLSQQKILYEAFSTVYLSKKKL
jgi:hypothetical protein